MKAPITHFALSLVLVFCCAEVCRAHTEVSVSPGGGGSDGDVQTPVLEETAYAIPLSGITIDGKLDDWPEQMAIYPIDWISSFYKPTPPEGPEDLTASFRVGYDLEASLVYLAIVVLDEDLVIHPEAPSHMNQDLCEVYVDADHSGGDAGFGELWGGTGGALQYVMVAGPGKVSTRVDGNPALYGEDTQTSGVQAAVLRLGHTTVYEWAIPLFESFPERRFQIELGKTIGFDVVVVDADGRESGNWVAWTPEARKASNSDLLGDLVFAQDYQGLDVALGIVAPLDYNDVGMIVGRVVKEKEKTPYSGLIVEVYLGDEEVGSVRTEAEGQYQLLLLAGEYTLKPRRFQGVKPSEAKGVTVRAGEETEADFAVTPIQPPKELRRVAAVYQALRGYRDTTSMEVFEVRPGMETRRITPMSFAFERPNRVRLESDSPSMQTKTSVISDGMMLTTYLEAGWMEGQKQYMQKEAPDQLTSTDLQVPMAGPGGSMLVQILMTDDPLKELMKGVEEVKKVGREKLNGTPVTVLELTVPVRSLAQGQIPSAGGMDEPINRRLWIGKDDYLIRQIAFEVDMESMIAQMPEEQQQWMPKKMAFTERHTAIESIRPFRR